MDPFGKWITVSYSTLIGFEYDTTSRYYDKATWNHLKGLVVGFVVLERDWYLLIIQISNFASKIMIFETAMLKLSDKVVILLKIDHFALIVRGFSLF